MTKTSTILVVCGIAVFSFLSSFYTTKAQSIENILADSEISITTTPEIPVPKQPTTIEAISYNTDLNKAEFSWFIDNHLVKDGIGIKKISIITPEAGDVSNVYVEIKTQEGNTVRKYATLQPAEIELLWEGQGYTPPFYKGKSLYVHQGTAKIVAIPNFINTDGTKINPKNLLYAWKKDGKAQLNASGIGKDSLTIEGAIISRDVFVEVRVSSIDNLIVAEKSLILKPQEPSIGIYENNPRYGIFYNQAIDTFTLIDREVTFIAEPFFFKDTIDYITFNWLINGKKTNEDSNVQTFRQEGEISGTSKITINANHISKILERAAAEIGVVFGKQSKEI